MIDPSIALSYKPVEQPNLAQEYGQILSLKTMANQQQLQSAQLTAVGQENQLRANQLQQQKAMNSAIQANVKVDPDGTPSIDHDGVVKSLAAAGQGQAALNYQAEMAKTRAELAKLNNEQLTGMAKTQEMIGGKLGAAINAQTPEAKQAAWTDGLNWAVKNKLVQPGQYPTQVPSDDQLRAIQLGSVDGAKQITAIAAEKRANATQQQADNSTKQVAISQQNADQTAVRDLNTADYQNKTVDYRNANLGERTRHDKAVEAQNAIDNARSSAAKGLTANGAAVQARADEKELQNLHQEENDLHTLRSQLGSAIASGKAFIDDKGKSHPISSDDDEKDQQIADMRARFDGATRRLQEVIPLKNNLIQKQGGTVAVPSDQALAKVNANGKTAAAPASTAKPQSSTPTPQIVVGTVIKNAKGERRQWTGTSWKTL